MRAGALVMMDALGFKGIWRAHKAEDVVATLRKLRERMNAEHLGIPVTSYDAVRVELLSDTIVIGIVGKQGAISHNSDQMAVATAAHLASSVMRSACSSPVPLAYRGCISFGEFILEDNFIVGPAVDEAAEAMNLAQGAFVWLTPSALRIGGDSFKSASVRKIFVPYHVPLKGGDLFETMVAPPFRQQATSAERAEIAEKIERTFGNSTKMEIAIKKQNTVTLLREIEKVFAEKL